MGVAIVVFGFPATSISGFLYHCKKCAGLQCVSLLGFIVWVVV
jgi:hypothetical protein